MPHRARDTVTLRDVAAEAGVSLATASRALGGGRSVAPENARKVIEAATRLRYTVDAAARAMNRGSDAIALIADDLATPAVAAVVAAMERQARTVDAFVTVSSTRGLPELQAATIRNLSGFRPRAVVLTSTRISQDPAETRVLDELLAFERGGGRVILYGSGSVHLPFDAIAVDDRGSARLMGEHLARTGHRRAIILAGTRERAYAAARTSGYVEGLLAAGADVQDIRIVNCEVSRQGGFDATAQLIREGLGGTDVLVAINDTVAIGVLSACRAAGIDVPGQVSVTGFDDVPLARDLTPRLTTIELPFTDIGIRAIEMAMRERPVGGPPARETIRGTLIVRESTRRA
ncbi:LacI family DNA-binding transcriptional regulator [Actinoplanes sp. NPDC026670]|uniref:LacI family DNA-binding transcriptional regulator n=1 Tax=Actinoplanes sp. NPDC026670 TaxID=3154700 RepID=UPI0033F63C08